MRRRVVTGVVAVVLALVGSAVLIAFVGRAEDRALEGEEAVSVWVVTEPVPAGTAGDEVEAFVESRRIPAKVRAEGAVSDLTTLEGRIAQIDLEPGEQVVLARFVEPRRYDATPSRIGLPTGKVEITVAVEPERALGGRVRPGDRVAVFASFQPFDITGGSVNVEGEAVPLPAEGTAGGSRSFSNTTRLVLQQVLVTEVQVTDEGEEQSDPSEDVPEIDQPAPATSGEVFVTLAVEPDAAERLVFAAEFGSIWLGNEPEPVDPSRSKNVTRGNVLEGSGSTEDVGAVTGGASP